jgi:predicted esterase
MSGKSVKTKESTSSNASRLSARPAPVIDQTEQGLSQDQEQEQPRHEPQRGLIKLGLGTPRDGLLYVPDSYDPKIPAPLVVALHGAGGNAQQGLGLLQNHADRHGFLILSIDSRRSTWDVLLNGFGPDVEFINRALSQTFGRYLIDAARIAIGGFSDGASYALSLGLGNGDLFGSVIAFSPGFMAPDKPRGLPPIYISHGRKDPVLPIEKCSRRLVPQLQDAGYEVNYHEFDGPHSVPDTIKNEAVTWWLALAPVKSA